MRRAPGLASPLLAVAACAAVAHVGACAPIDLDPGGPDKALLRYREVVEAQRGYEEAEAACAAAGTGAEAEPCRRREALAGDLRRRGYCRRPADPAAADPSARYALWVACRA